MLRTVCFLFIAAGAFLMMRTAVHYRHMLKQGERQIYRLRKPHPLEETICLALLYLFATVDIFALINVITCDLDHRHAGLYLMLFLGAMFIYMAVNMQRYMAASLQQRYRDVMKIFASAIDFKDSYTRGHSNHVYRIMKLFCEQLAPNYKKLNLPKLYDAALLHDIGKLGIADSILKKEGALCDEEWAIMKTHPMWGKYVLDGTCMSEISDWVLYHHERIDGTGYFGLKGDEIPIESRLIAIADTYSALCTNRSYRSKMSHETAIEMMRSVAGTQLDADLLEYFCRIEKENLESLTSEIISPREDRHFVLGRAAE